MLTECEKFKELLENNPVLEFEYDEKSIRIIKEMGDILNICNILITDILPIINSKGKVKGKLREYEYEILEK